MATLTTSADSETTTTAGGLRRSGELEAILGDVQFWLSLVERLGFDQATYQMSATQLTLDQLSRHFDSSSRGLLRVFRLFDKDHDQVLTLDEIARGLRQQALFQNATREGHAAFDELCVLMDPEKTKLVGPQEFLWALKSLRLAALLHGYMRRPRIGAPAVTGDDPRGGSPEAGTSAAAEDMVIHLHEYREDKIVAKTPLEAPVSFLFSPSPGESNMRVRWLHAHDANQRTVLGLAMKFGIDPRFIFDILYLWREQARADRVDAPPLQLFNGGPAASTAAEMHQLFIVVPVLRLTPRSEASCRPYEAWRRLKRSGLGRHAAPPLVIAEVEHCNLALLVVGEGASATVLSFTSDWGRLSKLTTDDVAPVTEMSNTNNLSAEEVGGGKKASRGNSEALEMLEVHDSLAAFGKILTTLHTSYSHLRTGDSHTLVLKSLCEITEDFLAVAKAYEYGLNVLQKRLDRQRDNMSNKDVRRIRKSIRQLSHLYRLVAPVLAVADTLGNMKWSGDAQLYLSDIRGNVTRFLDDAIAHREFARGMIDQFQNYCESKTSQILYLLTRVTTLFVPGQFFASIYGMNFIDEETGLPSIPELTWKYGYVFYWVVTISVTAAVLGIIFYITRRN